MWLKGWQKTEKIQDVSYRKSDQTENQCYQSEYAVIKPYELLVVTKSYFQKHILMRLNQKIVLV